jgi:hypothetical protein
MINVSIILLTQYFQKENDIVVRIPRATCFFKEKGIKWYPKPSSPRNIFVPGK